jgi:hypothetical protein
MNADPQVVKALISRLVGLVVSSVSVGPAGLTIAACRPGVNPVGLDCDAVVWIEGAIRIKTPTQLLFESSNYPSRESEPLLRRLLQGKSLSACSLSENGNRLRIVLEGDVMLVGYPFEDDGDLFSCNIYVYDRHVCKYIIIYSNMIEYFEELREVTDS